MGIGLTEEHLALAASVRGLAERTVEHAALAAQGVLGLHLPEECGGQGYGLLELVVALEALGERRAPGAYLPSVIASAALTRASGGDTGALGGLADRSPGARADGPLDGLPEGPRGALADGSLEELVAGLADGSLTAAVALGEAAGGAGPLALGSPDADLFLVPLEGGRWALLDRADVDVESVEGVDLDRALCSVTVRDGTAQDGTSGGGRAQDGTAREVGAGRVLGEVPVREVAAVLLGADACGVAAWAVATAADYAKVREQFGRPIGQFQGVKHRVAAALVALEQARAAVWDAAKALDDSPGRTRAGESHGRTPSGETRDRTPAGESPGRTPAGEPHGAGAGTGGDGGEARLAVGVAAVLAPDAAVRCAADAIQVLGGIGYTFEHEAHRFYRRALSDRMLAGDPGGWAEEVIRLALAGVRRSTEPDLPEEAAPVRDAIRARAEELRAEEPLARLGRFAREGWIMPYLPEPWGRGASPLEQVIIHQEFRDLKRPNLGIGAWAVPSIVRHGTPEQRERFLPRTFTGEIVWCQLFSEPGAGSDLAGLATKAVRVEGGWSLSGQKIWTSLAQYAHWGICLARTSPDKPKHEGISYFLVDMSSPGVTVKPLKEINGDEVFNEVFLDDVFVPDDLVVGEVDGGWRVARDTLSHERVALGDSWGPGARHTDMAGLIAKLPEPRQARLEEAGRLWAEGQALAALGLRVTLAQLSGSDPGTASSVRKLLGMRHSQAVSEFCWSLAPFDRHWSRMILTTRAFTIGGGTTEVQLNIIAERALGLPRDP